MNVNRKIAKLFRTDASDFLQRYIMLKESSTHIGSRSKLLIELLFALECSLKSLIFIESTESSKDTYSKIKKLGHRIEPLIHSLKEDTQTEYYKIIKADLSKYQVYGRYQLEAEIDFRSEKGTLDQEYYDTIANFQWLDSVYSEIQKLTELVDQKNPVYLTPKTFGDIDLNEELEYHKRLIDIRKNKKVPQQHI